MILKNNLPRNYFSYALYSLFFTALLFIIFGYNGWGPAAQNEQTIGEISRWCERVSGGFFREPVNTLGNLGFVVTGLYMFYKLSKDATTSEGIRMFSSSSLALLYASASTFLGPGTSESLLSTVSSSDGRGSSDIANQYGSLASAVGIDIGTAMGGQKDLAIKTIQSRDFLKHLLSNPIIFKGFVASEKYNRSSGELTYNSETLDRFQTFLKGDSQINFKEINPSFDILYSKYLIMLGISSQTESNFIKLSVTHISPKFAQLMLNEIISELNLKAKQEDLIKSNRAIEFLTLAIQDTQIQEVRATMSSLLENQLKTQLMANILDEYLLSILDKPHYPIFPSSISRKAIVFIFSFVGLMLSTLFFIAKQYFKSIKEPL